MDVLLEDSAGMPVVAEVEANIDTGNLVGLWQAVKYKHLIAAERELRCELARSFLIAPNIPVDIKAKCQALGIEPKEIQI